MIFVFNSFFVVCFVFNGFKVRKAKQVWQVGKENWPGGEPLYTLHRFPFPESFDLSLFGILSFLPEGDVFCHLKMDPECISPLKL